MPKEQMDRSAARTLALSGACLHAKEKVAEGQEISSFAALASFRGMRKHSRSVEASRNVTVKVPWIACIQQHDGCTWR
eukprot:scaffold114044_cov19-Tisochrysis_lutea.AAC.1